MNRKRTYRKFGICLLTLILSLSFSAPVRAEELPCRSATATGHYRHPESGEIEDSGGSDSEALGQSMVANVVDPDALVEEDPSGGYELSLRFHLMNSLSDIHFSVQEPGETVWEDVFHAETASADDQADLRLPIRSEDTIVRAECYVAAMGRSVIFYVTLSDFEEGNRGGFVRTEALNPEPEKPADADKSSDDGGGVLAGVTGVTSGGANAASGIESSSAELNAEVQAPEADVQQLNLSGSVWRMLFLVVFCAHLLAGLALAGGRLILDRLLTSGKGAPGTEASEEPMDEDPDETYLEDAWEDAEDENGV